MKWTEIKKQQIQIHNIFVWGLLSNSLHATATSQFLALSSPENSPQRDPNDRRQAKSVLWKCVKFELFTSFTELCEVSTGEFAYIFLSTERLLTTNVTRENVRGHTNWNPRKNHKTTEEQWRKCLGIENFTHRAGHIRIKTFVHFLWLLLLFLFFSRFSCCAVVTTVSPQWYTRKKEKKKADWLFLRCK